MTSLMLLFLEKKMAVSWKLVAALFLVLAAMLSTQVQSEETVDDASGSFDEASGAFDEASGSIDAAAGLGDEDFYFDDEGKLCISYHNRCPEMHPGCATKEFLVGEKGVG